MSQSKENNQYKTQSLDLAAFLVSKGYGINNVESGPKLATFCFDGVAFNQAQKYLFNPDQEMKTLQRFVQEKEKLIAFLRETYGR